MSISFNPNPTTNAAGTFTTSTYGFVSGTFQDDPAVRYQLKGGAVASTQSTPLWGGLPITLSIPLAGVGALGPTAIAATDYADTNGWMVFNQAAAGIITPSSSVPLYSAGTSINFFEPGSNARIVVPIDSTLVNTLLGESITTPVSWDFTTNKIVTFSTTALPVVIEQIEVNGGVIVSYDSGTGFANWVAGAVAVIRI